MTSTSPIVAPAVPVPLPTAVPIGRYMGLLLAPGMGTYAFNAVAVTMPQVRQDLGASEVQLELVVAGYGIPFAVFLILGGRLGDRFGRHLLFTIGVIGFLLSALACAVAPTIEALILARVAQGLAAALCTPQVLATIQATSAGPARVRAIAAFGASGGIGAALGQVLGGALAGATVGGAAGWRVTYLVIVVIAIVSVVWARRSPRSRAHERVAIDLVGALGLAVGVFLVVSALTVAPAVGWSWPVFAAMAVGAAALGALWAHQSRIERSGRVPLLPPSVLRLRPLQLGLLCAGLFFAGYSAILYVFPRALEGGLGATPLVAGLALLPFAIVFAVTSLLLGPIQRRLGEATLAWGVGLQIVALAAMGATAVLAWGPGLVLWLQPALLVLGAGQAMIFSPLTQSVVREVPVEAAGLSGGMFGTVQQLGLSLGVVVIGGATTAVGWSGRAELLAGTGFDIVAAVAVLLLAVPLILRRARADRAPGRVPDAGAH
ncbi:MFS transporter [Microbacterium sp. SORGH_AS_0888]|uniref:MFS transporter n=1 Tax=Microbacterium sp. SORGH_AS_0888 TaxID=3041791 RepID=UPI00278AB165|nr:MFS transporter [Microbacterium sp. SORGH_AS_0888]MDQ1128083.1 MFS family permease [Microbacterium sp. SORGH_AS_0888]